MKKIEAIGKSSRLEFVRMAIAPVCVEYRIDVVPMAKVDLAVPDEAAGRGVAAIVDAARTGNKGDGRIFVPPVEEAIRIRTRERGEAAA